MPLSTAGPGRSIPAEPVASFPCSLALPLLLSLDVGWTSGVVPEHEDIEKLLRARGLEVIVSDSLLIGLSNASYTVEVISPTVGVVRLLCVWITSFLNS